MGIRKLNIHLSYAGKGDHILNDFLLPVLLDAKRYDRITSFFTVESLLAISQGIDALYNKQGKMRLLIGIHSIPVDFVEATIFKDLFFEQIEKIRVEVETGISLISDKLEKERLATIAWMIDDGLLEVKVAAVNGPGLFHLKTLIIADENDDRIVAVGSPNETTSGLGNNYEQLMVARSWDSLESFNAVDEQVNFFESLWNNDNEDVIVSDISEETAKMIHSALGNDYDKFIFEPSVKQNDDVGVIALSAKMISNFFVSGDIPSLYMHQERAVINALSRWPIRVLFADEVGLGKTFEVAATMKFLMQYCGIKRVIILSPKSVLKQWQDELIDHFHINAWMYDSVNHHYINAQNEIKYMNSKNPLGKGSPNIILMSAQYARGNNANGDVFSKNDTILPDLLIVDEAHAARISKDLSGKSKKTRLYKMVENVNRAIPHLILATATPMQKDADEYHAMLNLLGLPVAWRKVRNYQTSLRLISKEDEPDLSDACNAAKLLLSTLSEMHPTMKDLDKSEESVVQNLVQLSKCSDLNTLGNYVLENWFIFRVVFIKLHPGHLLTVRNTRRSLATVGYEFPERKLYEESLTDVPEIELFYNKVDNYLSFKCFSVEKKCFPGKNISVSFVRISYQQRVASSLFSCIMSLNRRFEKISGLMNQLKRPINRFVYDETNFDDFDNDELLVLDEENGFDIDLNNVDITALKRAIEIESTELSSLITHAKSLLNQYGDPKIEKAINLAMSCLTNGDQVLIFSRYTDTIEALVKEFRNKGFSKKFRFGIYTGEKSVVVDHDDETKCNKSMIKKELFSGQLKIMFCSDAASEGLNLQAARVLINVDVPWTPARLEQRIGRIARLGQTAKQVDVYNIWYPHSIEATMYHRIQRRLEIANLAIGEYPELLAMNIKDAIKFGDDEHEAQTLNSVREIRNSMQIASLQALWGQLKKETESQNIRNSLIEICDKKFSIVRNYLQGVIREYEMPDGEVVQLSAKDGISESISLHSKPWRHIDFTDNNLQIVTNHDNKPIAFAYMNDGELCLIKHESVFNLIFGGKFTSDCILVDYPAMLPNPRNLDLFYSIDCKVGERPQFWCDEEEER